jgi:hypothetical protein
MKAGSLEIGKALVLCAPLMLVARIVGLFDTYWLPTIEAIG